MEIEILQRPGGPAAAQILAIVEKLSGTWFTDDVLPAIRLDLLFQDAVCAREDNGIRAFILFTSQDGALHITLMGTDPDHRRRGYGTALMRRLEEHARQLGFAELVAFTVPPDKKPAFQDTVDFYFKCGFRLAKRYTELWQSGAWELRKVLPLK